MTKWTDGWLCRDKDGWLIFFPSPKYVRGSWQRPSFFVWPAGYWRETYDLALPAKGKKLCVSIQL